MDTRIAKKPYDSKEQEAIDKKRASYRDYFHTAEDTMSIAEADIIYRRLYAEIDQDDPDVPDFFENMFSRARDYCDMRFQWKNTSLRERTLMDEARTQKHDAFINALLMLGSVLKAKGRSADWLDLISEDLWKTGRKRAGDFGCYLVLFRSLNGR